VLHLDGDGGVRNHAGDLSLLLEHLAAEAAARQQAAAVAAAKAKTASKPAAPKPRKLSTREQQELVELPARIEAAERQLQSVDQGLQDPAVYTAAGRARFEALTKERTALPGQIQTLYARWEELEALAEQARAKGS
jgi:ABC transport system ATP-binding/permease protein